MLNARVNELSHGYRFTVLRTDMQCPQSFFFFSSSYLCYRAYGSLSSLHFHFVIMACQLHQKCRFPSGQRVRLLCREDLVLGLLLY